MDCIFSKNGIAIDYFGTVKPCCSYRPTGDYRRQNSITQVNLVRWHESTQMQKVRAHLAEGNWPTECASCQNVESQGRGDSIRLGGQSAYSHYDDQDLTLEIRGGAVCNFACQTCWPQASSRVAQFYRRADIEFEKPQDVNWDFDLLLPIKSRLKDIVLLGGEPFYDQRCQQFLSWLCKNDVSANLVIFTNGSVIDQRFIEGFQGKLTLVFSIDAIEGPAEYIRYGGDWHEVKKNYNWCKAQLHVETRVNVTTSPYNYYYLDQLIDWLVQDWPAMVIFGVAGLNPNSDYMDESVFPVDKRGPIMKKLHAAISMIDTGKIPFMQKLNARNALKTIIHNLQHKEYDPIKHQKFQDFVIKMDAAKGASIVDYCPEVAEYLCINPVRLDKVS